MKKNLKQEILKLREEGKTYNQIKKELQCSKSTISYHCRSNNTAFNDRMSDEKIVLIREEFKKIGLYKTVARKLKTTYDTVKKYTKDLDSYRKKGRTISRSQSVVNWRIRTKKKLVDYKGGKCIKCGYDKCIDALELHHRDPNDKDFTISGKSWSFERLKSEADKCDLVCSNCHKEIHYKLKYIPH